MENLEKKIQSLIDLYKTKKLYRAESLNKDLIRDYPKVVYLYNLLGLILSEQKKVDEAIKYFEKGIKIKPDNAMLHNNLASAYRSKGKYKKAEDYYKKSIFLDSKISEPHNNLGNLYLAINKYNEAINSYKRAINIFPQFFVAQYNLGLAYKNTGDFENSKKHLREAIKFNSNFYTAHRTLGQLIKYKKGDEHLDLIMKIYKDPKIENFKKSELSFALAKALDDIKDYKEAFKYFDEGNYYRRKELNFSIEEEKKEFISIKRIFNNEFVNKFSKSGNKDSTTIFILGMPRSGTTLVEQIISSHPKVFGGGELYFLPELINKNFAKVDDLINLDDKIIKIISKEYINKLKKISFNSHKVSDKLPINFKWIGLIKILFPNSKVIHCVRDPRDTCLSIFKNYFATNKLNFAYNLDELLQYYRLYSDLMIYWKILCPEFIIDINYEKLIQDPKRQIQTLLESCNLSWNNKCLNYHNNKRVIKTASDIQVRKKLYKSSTGLWKNYDKYLKDFFIKLPN